MFNLTQHAATPEQIQAGVVDVGFDRDLLNFDYCPSEPDLIVRAQELAAIVVSSGHTQAMIGGAPFFMSSLESALMDHGVEPVYAFSKRESVEEKQDDGSVVKRNVFRHSGFVRPYDID